MFALLMCYAFGYHFLIHLITLFTKYSEEADVNDDVTCYRESFMEIMDEIEVWYNDKFTVNHI